MQFAESNDAPGLWNAFREGRHWRVPVTTVLDEQFFLPMWECSFRQFNEDVPTQVRVQLLSQQWAQENVQTDELVVFRQNVPTTSAVAWTVAPPRWMDENEFYGARIAMQEDDYSWGQPISLSKNGLLRRLQAIDVEARVLEGTLYPQCQEMKRAVDGMEFAGRPVQLNPSPVGAACDGIFTKAAEIRGLEQLCIDLHEDPAFARELLDTVTYLSIERIKCWYRLEASVSQFPLDEVFYLCDDSVTMISAAAYEEFVLPCHERLYSALTIRPRWLHLCGRVQHLHRVLYEKAAVRIFNGPGPQIDLRRMVRELGQPAYSMRVMRLSLSRRREIRPNGEVLVFDLSQAPIRVLTLDPARKTAVEKTLLNTEPTKDPDLLAILSDIQDGTEEDLGVKEVEGRMAQGFHAVYGEKNAFTVWADRETGLPIRIELRQPILARTIVMSDFDFKVDLGESLFSTTAPEGYTVQRIEKDGANPTEQDLIRGLRAVAEFLDGRFPPVLEIRRLQKTLRVRDERNKIAWSEKEVAALERKAWKAWKYVNLLQEFYGVERLRYVGDGVRLGDRESPVIWWRFRATDTCRVVYGDLSVRDVMPKDVPGYHTTGDSGLSDIAPYFPYACTQILQYDGRGPARQRLMRWDLRHRREIHPGGRVFVFDLSHKPVEILELIPEEKRAVLTTAPGRGPAKDPDIVGMAIDMQFDYDAKLDEQEVEGHTVRGYQGFRQGSDWTVWLDSETDLPVRIELKQPNAKRTLTYCEFDFDANLEESLFSTTVPDGYTPSE